MITFLAFYFTFGVGFYIGSAAKDPRGFVRSNAAGILRGLLLGIPFWPIGLIVTVYFAMKRLETDL